MGATLELGVHRGQRSDRWPALAALTSADHRLMNWSHFDLKRIWGAVLLASNVVFGTNYLLNLHLFGVYGVYDPIRDNLVTS